MAKRITKRVAAAPVSVNWRRLRKPPTNGARETTRRKAQIATGRLRAENGLQDWRIPS
jgi:hypothetical protein